MRRLSPWSFLQLKCFSKNEILIFLSDICLIFFQQKNKQLERITTKLADFQGCVIINSDCFLEKQIFTWYTML